MTATWICLSCTFPAFTHGRAFCQKVWQYGQFGSENTKNIPADIAAKIDANQELMAKYGFFATPSMVWKNQQGEFKSAQGMTEDLREMFEK